MIFLSGVVYPIPKMPLALQYFSKVLPLTYTIDGLRRSFSIGSDKTVFFDTLILIFFFFLFIIPAAKLLYKKFE